MPETFTLDFLVRFWRLKPGGPKRQHTRIKAGEPVEIDGPFVLDRAAVLTPLAPQVRRYTVDADRNPCSDPP